MVPELVTLGQLQAVLHLHAQPQHATQVALLLPNVPVDILAPEMHALHLMEHHVLQVLHVLAESVHRGTVVTVHAQVCVNLVVAFTRMVQGEHAMTTTVIKEDVE